MSDLLKKIDEATTQLAALNAEKQRAAANIAALEKEAKALEVSAREKWAERSREKDRLAELNKSAGELDAVLRHAKVQSDVQTAAADAFKAKSEAEATLARLSEKEKQLDALLAKAAEAAEAAPKE